MTRYRTPELRTWRKDKGTLNTIVEETVKFDVESNAGNKGIGRRGATDCLRFAHWATSPSAVPKECEAIIATRPFYIFQRVFQTLFAERGANTTRNRRKSSIVESSRSS